MVQALSVSSTSTGSRSSEESWAARTRLALSGSTWIREGFSLRASGSSATSGCGAFVAGESGKRLSCRILITILTAQRGADGRAIVRTIGTGKNGGESRAKRSPNGREPRSRGENIDSKVFRLFDVKDPRLYRASTAHESENSGGGQTDGDEESRKEGRKESCSGR